jgi:hypothetical protein
MRRGVWRIWLVLSVSSLAHACSCGGPNPICSSFWQSPAIFRGTVVELTLLRDPVREVKNLDGTTSSIISPGKYKVRFRVSETFRGEAQEEIAATSMVRRASASIQKTGTCSQQRTGADRNHLMSRPDSLPQPCNNLRIARAASPPRRRLCTGCHPILHHPRDHHHGSIR